MNGDQNSIRQTGRGNQPSSLRPCNAGGMGFVDDEFGSVFFRDRDEIGNRRAVAIHTENAFADNEFLHRGRNILL